MKNWKYIDGAKAAKVGNAKTIVAQVGTWKIYYDEEEKEYYTDYKGSIMDNPGFKSKQEVIDYIAKKQKAGNSSIGNSAYDDGVKKGKEDKRKGKLITAAGFDMHVPNFSKYSYQEKEEFKKGYYSSNDLTKEDIYKSWKTGNSDGVARMFQGLVKDEDKDEKHYEGAIDDLEKVGNKGLWNASRTIYGKWNEKDSRPDDEYARLTWLGEGKGGLVNIWKGQSMTSEKFGSTDRKELERWAERRIGNKYKPGDEVTVRLPGKGARRALVVRDEGNVIKVAFSEDGPEVTVLPSEVSNSKVGNIQFAGDYYDIVQENPEEFYIYLNGGARRYGPYRTKAAAEIELKKILDRRNRTGNSYSDKLPTAMDYRKALDEIIEKKNLNPDEARRKYGQFTYAQWEKELGHKIGNSEDEKFAYVMREFKEGKLKSSSGETVTDPEQAKAIAYSESKKAENGLARARRAMNKGRVNFEDDIVVIKKNGNILYKGMQDYAEDDDIPWKYNEAKGIYEAPGGLTKEKIG